MKQYLVLSLFAGLASTALAVVVGPKPTITRQPVGLAKFEGGVAVFSATATNATSYQWAFNTLPLSDGNGVTGSHSNVLTINPVPTDDAGSYQLIAINAFGSVTSSVAKLTVLLETAKPAVTIVEPAIGTRSTNITFSGTASDSVRVTGVGYVISNLNNPHYVLSGAAALSSGKGSSNWTFMPGFLSPGTNILMVTATNYPGKTNTATRAFFFRDTAPFSLAVYPAGYGTVTGHASFAGDPAPANGSNLYVGEGYTLTATPAPHTLFSYWTVDNNQIVSTNKTFSFTMENGLQVQAVFHTNDFMTMAGRYDGIFSGNFETNSGLIGNLLLGTNGVYSGTLYLAGSAYPLHGAFYTSGETATETVPRANASGSNITVNLSLVWPGVLYPRTIEGSVLSKGWESDNLTLIAAQTNAQTNSYTMLLEPFLFPTVPGDGYALITNRNGVLTLGGALADGSTFTQSTALGEDGEFPIYANLYNGTGLLLGRASPTNASPGLGRWIKPPAKSGAYTNGFNDLLVFDASVWSQAQGTYTNLVAKDPYLAISGPGLSTDLYATLVNTNNITVKGEGTNLSVFGFNPANGMLSVVFTNNLHQRVTGYGALLQNISTGGGYYLGATNDGSFSLSSTPPPQ